MCYWLFPFTAGIVLTPVANLPPVSPLSAWMSERCDRRCHDIGGRFVAGFRELKKKFAMALIELWGTPEKILEST
jgi:hypothetical protein